MNVINVTTHLLFNFTGAVTPLYLALLPLENSSIRGDFVYDKRVLKWKTESMDEEVQAFIKAHDKEIIEINKKCRSM